MYWKIKTTEKERNVALRLRRSSQFYRFLWEIREELFGEGFEEELVASYQPRGQNPCPPAMLAMVMLLQRYEGVSDAGAVDAAENDRRWQLILGTLGKDQSPFGQGTLVRFRNRMIWHDLDKKLLERTIELAKSSGSFGWKKLRASLDSSPLEGAGRVEDTWNLIGRAMSKVVHAVSVALDVGPSDVINGAKLSVLRADSVKSALDIDWDDEIAQREALQKLVSQAGRLEKWVVKRAGEKTDEEPLKESLEIMKKIVVQDMEPEPPDDSPKIAKGVPRDRIISVGDTEMRHGRKSKSKVIKGYKRHVAIANNIILGTAVESANSYDASPAKLLLDSVRLHGEIEILDIDRGYLASPEVEALYDSGAIINSRPWNGGKYRGKYKKEHFHIDLRNSIVTCPAGKTGKIFPCREARFNPDDCGECDIKSNCTSAKRRTISIHHHEALHIKLRKQKTMPSGRKELRQRVAVEHRLARIAAIQGNKAKYKGVRKNEMDLNRAAAIANLQEISRFRNAA